MKCWRLWNAQQQGGRPNAGTTKTACFAKDGKRHAETWPFAGWKDTFWNAKGMLLQSRKMQYVFKKGSSPTTIWHNLLTINNISRSEPCLQLITPGCHTADVMSDESWHQLITPQTSGIQRITCRRDEWRVNTKNFSVSYYPKSSSYRIWLNPFCSFMPSSRLFVSIEAFSSVFPWHNLP